MSKELDEAMEELKLAYKTMQETCTCDEKCNKCGKRKEPKLQPSTYPVTYWPCLLCGQYIVAGVVHYCAGKPVYTPYWFTGTSGATK